MLTSLDTVLIYIREKYRVCDWSNCFISVLVKLNWIWSFVHFLDNFCQHRAASARFWSPSWHNERRTFMYDLLPVNNTNLGRISASYTLVLYTSFSQTDKCKLYCSQFALVLAELNLHNETKVIWQRLHYMTLHDRLTDGQTDRQTLWTSVTVASNAASMSVATLQASEGESPVLVVTCSTQHFRGRPGCLLQVSNCPEPWCDVTERCRAWWAGAAWSICLSGQRERVFCDLQLHSWPVWVKMHKVVFYLQCVSQ